jgi:hypothetical protein
MHAEVLCLLEKLQFLSALCIIGIAFFSPAIIIMACYLGTPS